MTGASTFLDDIDGLEWKFETVSHLFQPGLGSAVTQCGELIKILQNKGRNEVKHNEV